ncbi:MAG: amidohydrolase family protein [Roseiflexaceae bacterium]
MRIDFHQHYLPQPLTLADEAAQQWLHQGSRVQDYADTDAIIAALDAAQLDVAVLQGEYYVHQHNCVARNRVVQAVCARHPHRLKAFAVVQPRHPSACDEIARCRDAGMWGVGELNPAIQQFSVRDPAVQRVFAYCERHAIPVLMHVNEPVGRGYPGKIPTPLTTYYELAACYPELTLILAHWGGGLLWYETMPAVRAVLRNVYYDTAASPLIFPDTQTMAQMARLSAPHKIIFGSDFPIRHVVGQPATIAPFATQLAAAVDDTALHHAWFGATALQLINRQPPHTSALTTPPPMPITAQTGVVVLVAQYPETHAVLMSYGIVVDEHTPWWQTLATAAATAGISPAQFTHLITAIREITAHAHPE